MADTLDRGGRQAVFLDRDGTISRYMAYCCRPQDFRLLPGVVEAIRRLNRLGLAVIVVTNQSAVARGWLTMEGLTAIHDKMQRGLSRFGASVDAIYICPHHPDDGCVCRKPGIGMFRQASEDLGLSLAGSFLVGDRLIDVRSGRAAGCRTVLVRSGHAPEVADGIAPDHEAATLREAVDWIVSQDSIHMPSARRRASRRKRPRSMAMS